MAISEVVVQSLSAYQTQSSVIAADPVDTADGNYIDVSEVKTSNLMILIESLDTANVVTFAAGDFSDEGIGDLSVTTKAGLTGIVLEGSRFKDSDERIVISSTTTGCTTANKFTLRAIELP